MAVLTAKKPVAHRPSRRISPGSGPPARPRTIEANTSGTTTIWIVARNSRPGNASQLPITSPVAGWNRPVSGPITMPVTSPSPMPMSTCSHSLPSTSRVR